MTTRQSALALEIEAGVATITLCRPEKMNAMGPDFWRELPEMINALSQDASARALIISSEGKHFTAGMDLETLSNLPVGKPGDPHLQSEAFTHAIRRYQDAFTAIERARIPVIAAIQGGCIGGGVDMISACDIRLCTSDAWFCIEEINLGMTANVGTFPRMARLLPDGWMRQLAYTGQRLQADTALRLGFVNAVYETQDELLTHALSLAAEIASRDPLAITGTKEMLNYSKDHSTDDTLRHVGLWNAAMLSPARLQESMKARAEKRAPTYPDLLSVRDTSSD